MAKLFQLFNWLRFLYTVNGAVSGLILGVIGNYLSGGGSMASLKYLIPTLVFLLTTIMILEVRQKRIINVVLRISTARTDAEKAKQAKKGLIAFVSLYNPVKSTVHEGLSVKQREEAALSKNYGLLDFEKSNLQPLIEAICSHRTALQCCWLIGTTDTEQAKGSILYQDALIEFLHKEKGIKCNFYYGTNYAIPLDDDAQICQKTYDMVRAIYQEAANLGLDGKDVIADYTGGMRGMVSGMMLACLHEDNDIQLMGSRYNGLARPEGELFPVRMQFYPDLKI